MTELQYTCLRVAVALARSEEIKKASLLKQRLLDHNFSQDDIDAALKFWADRANKKG